MLIIKSRRNLLSYIFSLSFCLLRFLVKELNVYDPRDQRFGGKPKKNINTALIKPDRALQKSILNNNLQISKLSMLNYLS